LFYNIVCGNHCVAEKESKRERERERERKRVGLRGRETNWREWEKDERVTGRG
jgi:hypothetical protein